MSRKKYRTRIALTDYESSLEDLTPQAEKEARLKVLNLGKSLKERLGRCFYTQFFHKAMTRLAIEKGIRRF